MTCVSVHIMNAYGKVEVELHSFLTSALRGGQCQPHAFSCPPRVDELLVPTE